MEALQDVWPDGTCFGCGPANPFGLHIKSYWSDDGQFVIAKHIADPQFTSGYENVMYGGLIACLIDCHSNWAAMAFAYRHENRPHGSTPDISCATGSLNIKYLAPTPLDEPTYLKAWVEGEIGRKIKVLCELGPEERVTATSEGVFVRVQMKKSEGTNLS